MPAQQTTSATRDRTQAGTARFQNTRLALMLLSLHLAIAWDAGQWWARGLLLAHFGLFLLWQPVWRGERRIPASQGLLVLGLGTLFALSGNWWLVAAWIAVLFALIGGGVPATVSRGARIGAVISAAYLITMLLAWVLPQLMRDPGIANQTAPFVRFGLVALPLVVLAIPAAERLRDSPIIIDLFYTLVLFLMALVLGLGSFVILHQQVVHGEGAYLFGVIQVLLAIAALLLGLSWLWNPRAGFSGIGALLSRYLLGLGLPFEQRMRRLANLAETETRPEQFLRAALSDLLDLPWTNGYVWVTAGSSGEVGIREGTVELFETGTLHLELYASRALTPAILIHQKLLVQMVGHFYEGLRREEQRRQSAYTQAIYETGARLTHDVKNLLQSLRSICAAAEMRGGDEAAFKALVQRQLPHIAQRLGATLEKLRSPEVSGMTEAEAADWWRGLEARYAGRKVRFLPLMPDACTRLPAELFDSVADTLLENGLYKVGEGRAAQVTVQLAQGPSLLVSDDGEAVDPQKAGELFRRPVASDSGLGVGLYQAAGFAAKHRYRLQLAENRRGRVCFALRPQGPG